MLKNFAEKVESPNKIPSQRHFAILVFKTSSVHVPGDERSRTNPGHGYPAHDVTSTSYEYWAVRNEKALREAVEYLEEKKRESYSKPDPYAVIEARPVAVKTRVEIDIG